MTKFSSEIYLTLISGTSICTSTEKLILSEFITFSNLRNSYLSMVHSYWPSPVRMTHFCLVSTSLGAQVLILIEFVTFNKDL